MCKNQNNSSILPASNHLLITQPTSYLLQVKNTSGLWKWLDDVVIPVVYAGEWYNGQKEPITVYTGNKLSILLGMPRLRQLRIKKGMQSDEVAFRNVFHSILLFYSFLL